jgi:hypothetical protein
MMQLLFEQVVVATFLLASTGHVTPQPPQLLSSSAVGVSQPSAMTSLQLLYLSYSKEQEVVVVHVISIRCCLSFNTAHLLI